MVQKKPDCSFCGKSHKEVRKLIAGPGIYICDSCINVCKNILDKELALDEERAAGSKPPSVDSKPPSTNSSLSIQEIRERLELLRQLRDEKTITEKDFQARAKLLIERI